MYIIFFKTLPKVASYPAYQNLLKTKYIYIFREEATSALAEKWQFRSTIATENV